MTKRADDAMFRDRRDAGRALAQALSKYKDDPAVIVVALPRGGVVIGYEISLALHLPLDVLVVRKLGTPVNPELAMGALAETGYRYLNEDVIRTYGVTVEQLDAEVRRQEREILRRSDKYRGGRRLPPLKGNTVLVVDDGIATGATLYAALAALRQAEAPDWWWPFRWRRRMPRVTFGPRWTRSSFFRRRRGFSASASFTSAFRRSRMRK